MGALQLLQFFKSLNSAIISPELPKMETSTNTSPQSSTLERAKGLDEFLLIDNRKQLYISENGQHAASELTVSTKHFLKAAFRMNLRKKTKDRNGERKEVERLVID